MAKINESAFPESHKDCPNPSRGLSKLEYTAVKIFCALQKSSFDVSLSPESKEAFFEESRYVAIKQAKLLLQECEEEASK